MSRVLEKEIQLLHAEHETDDDLYLYRYALFHEDMHTEAFTYTRQTLNYPTPIFSTAVQRPEPAGPLEGDAHVPACDYQLGAKPEDGFCFDNEKWAHPVHVDAFDMARAPVTNLQFLEFVEAGGYDNSDH
jgi:iron(II)-dependent oxidoreductase